MYGKEGDLKLKAERYLVAFIINLLLHLKLRYQLSSLLIHTRKLAHLAGSSNLDFLDRPVRPSLGVLNSVNYIKTFKDMTKDDLSSQLTVFGNPKRDCSHVVRPTRMS